MAKLDAFYIV